MTVFCPYGSHGASARVRVLQWLEFTDVAATVHDFAGLANNRPNELAKHLPRVLAAQLRTQRLAHRDHGRVLIHREVTPFSSGGLAAGIAARSELSVYDFDDALMWTETRRPGGLWSKAESCLRTVRSVDRVIAGSEVLAEWAQKHNPNVELIPTCVDPGLYRLKSDYAVGENPRLVWLGSPSTEAYLQLVENPLLEVNRATGARLTVISAGSRSLGALDTMVDRVTWTPGVESRLSEYDVAIAPLGGGPWERGKCAYKVLQYGAAGLPSVLSPVGANAVAAKTLGLLTATESSTWAESIMDLLQSSAEEREAVGKTARSGVRDHYSFSRWEPEWLAAVGEAPGRRGR